jgi:hypothetical protein
VAIGLTNPTKLSTHVLLICSVMKKDSSQLFRTGSLGANIHPSTSPCSAIPCPTSHMSREFKRSSQVCPNSPQ